MVDMDSQTKYAIAASSFSASMLLAWLLATMAGVDYDWLTTSMLSKMLLFATVEGTILYRLITHFDNKLATGNLLSIIICAAVLF